MKIVLITGENKYFVESIAKDCGIITNQNSLNYNSEHVAINGSDFIEKLEYFQETENTLELE